MFLEDESIRDNDLTPITCMSCGGHWKIEHQDMNGYAYSKCRWCVQGAMTESMIKKWRNRKRSK
jgi:hypothetical protein